MRRVAGMPWLRCLPLLFLALVAGPARAQMPLHPPEIRLIFPLGGCRGSVVEVLVEGQNVADPSAVSISGTGIRALLTSPPAPLRRGEGSKTDGGPVTKITPSPLSASERGLGGEVNAFPKPRVVGNVTARVRFEIAPDAPLGVREFRLLTPAGLTNRALFEVSEAMASHTESEPNNTWDAAAKLAVPTTVEGKIQAGEDVDLYRFTVASGDEMSFRVTADPLASPLDAVLTLRDAAGKELATNDDFGKKDPALGYRFTNAGEYGIEVRDLDYGGSLESSYRLTISREPILRTLYPLGAARGTLADLSLFGLNLGQLAGRNPDWYMLPVEAVQSRYEIPADAAPGAREFRITTPGGTSNPVNVEVLDIPELREVEPNDDVTRAPLLAVPGVGHGQIYGGKSSPGSDTDLFRIPAKKGQKLQLSLRAGAAGSRLDGLIVVRGADGKKLGRADDSDGSRDPKLEFDPPADGEYVVEVSDLNGAGGLEYSYMLRVEPVAAPKANFTLAIYPANPSVPRGGSTPVEVRVTRTGGFTGPVRFELPPLPQGVTAIIPPYAATAERFYIALNGATDAPLALGEFGLKGTAEVEGKAITREATGSERVWDLAPLHAVPTKLFGVGVCEAPDFTLRLDKPEITLAPGESTTVTVLVNKTPNYPRGIPIRAATVDYGGGALPTGLSVGRVTLPPEAKQVAVSVSAAKNTPPGEYPIFICGLSNPSTNDYILVAQLAPPLVVKVTAKQ